MTKGSITKLFKIICLNWSIHSEFFIFFPLIDDGVGIKMLKVFSFSFFCSLMIYQNLQGYELCEMECVCFM